MSLRILIADDAPYIREIIKNILVDEAVEFIEDAVDGEEAVEHAIRLKPDFIFMDIALPKMSGIQATKEILKELEEIRIVALSSLHDANMIQNALDAGCVDFIKKPFSVEEIQQAIQQDQKKQKGIING